MNNVRLYLTYVTLILFSCGVHASQDDIDLLKTTSAIQAKKASDDPILFLTDIMKHRQEYLDLMGNHCNALERKLDYYRTLEGADKDTLAAFYPDFKTPKKRKKGFVGLKAQVVFAKNKVQQHHALWVKMTKRLTKFFNTTDRDLMNTGELRDLLEVIQNLSQLYREMESIRAKDEMKSVLFCSEFARSKAIETEKLLVSNILSAFKEHSNRLEIAHLLFRTMIQRNSPFLELTDRDEIKIGSRRIKVIQDDEINSEENAAEIRKQQDLIKAMSVRQQIEPPALETHRNLTKSKDTAKEALSVPDFDEGEHYDSDGGRRVVTEEVIVERDRADVRKATSDRIKLVPPREGDRTQAGANENGSVSFEPRSVLKGLKHKRRYESNLFAELMNHAETLHAESIKLSPETLVVKEAYETLEDDPRLSSLISGDEKSLRFSDLESVLKALNLKFRYANNKIVATDPTDHNNTLVIHLHGHTETQDGGIIADVKTFLVNLINNINQ